MLMMKLFIKNMVCYRCIVVVEILLDDLNLKANRITLGEVVLQDTLNETQFELLKSFLEQYGLELIQDPQKQLINTVKILIISKVQAAEIEKHFKLSTYLAKSTFKDYSFLTKLFTKEEGITIERFYMLQRIEKAKELLLYGISHASEIANQLGFSSVQHFSNQFKKVTGISPAYFKRLGNEQRLPIDKITFRVANM
jgi:AraC family transcriptional regulator